MKLRGQTRRGKARLGAAWLDSAMSWRGLVGHGGAGRDSAPARQGTAWQDPARLGPVGPDTAGPGTTGPDLPRLGGARDKACPIYSGGPDVTSARASEVVPSRLCQYDPRSVHRKPEGTNFRRSRSRPAHPETLRHRHLRGRGTRPPRGQDRTPAPHGRVRRRARHQVLQVRIRLQRLGQNRDHEPAGLGHLRPVRPQETASVIQPSGRVGHPSWKRGGGDMGGRLSAPRNRADATNPSYVRAKGVRLG